jgi:hypothetical protein
MDREHYYTLTDIQKKFKITRKQLDDIFIQNNIKPSQIVPITTTYTIYAHYYNKEEIDNLQLPLRSTK